MKILITGALGHIGSRIIRDIPMVFPEAEITMIDNLSTQRYSSLFHLPTLGRYRFIEGDVLDIDLTPYIRTADVILHLAAITDAAGSFKNRDQLEHVNFQSTKKIGEICAALSRPLIHISSTSVYGTQDAIVSEDCPESELKPQSPYAETKLREENFLQQLAGNGKLRFVTCRFGTIAGISPGIRFHTAVNKFCWQAVFGQPLTVWRTALFQKRPYLAINDAVAALLFIIKNDLFEGKVYNIVTTNLTVNDIITSIQRFKASISIKYVDTEIMNQLSYEVSSDRFRKLGFTFTGNIDQCIADTLGLLWKSGGEYV
ncbi:MAG TPA: SDR family oxidoreductase [Syntrophales bacterium]|nr:SDR family oxidoreductase [Syntrophales bacterium]